MTTSPMSADGSLLPGGEHAASPDVRWGVLYRDGAAVASVWAPAIETAAVVTQDGRRIPMAPAGGGWHRAVADDLPPGTLYRFALDGMEVPDPASRCQPDGPAGWSQVVDPDLYRWRDAGWQGRPWNEMVFYELHLGTFSEEGTCLGAIAHLDHLADLGITAVELMPVSSCPGSRNWGYDGVLPYTPSQNYGTPDDLRRLVDECHARGICVFMDVVYNHFGPEWNMLWSYAPGFFTAEYSTPWGSAIDFASPHSGPVRGFFAQNAAYWIRDFHMDGLRLDAVQAVFDSSTVHVLDEIAATARAATRGRHVHLVLENDDNEARLLEPASRGGADYDAQWNDDFHHVMRVLVTGRRDGYYSDYADSPLDGLGRTLAEGFIYQGQPSAHRGGRNRGTPSGHLAPTAFVVFLQNHDQVGNTPFGQRLTDLAPPAAIRGGTAVLLLSPAIPMLFMGQEWGSARPFDYFCDHAEPLAGLVRDGRRAEFSHLPEFSEPAAASRLADPNAAATFAGSRLDWNETGQPMHAEWLALHRRLLEVRRRCVVPLLPLIGGGAGSYRTVGSPEPGGAGALEVVWRLSNGNQLVLAANMSGLAVDYSGEGALLFRLEEDGTGGQLGPWDVQLRLR